MSQITLSIEGAGSTSNIKKSDFVPVVVADGLAQRKCVARRVKLAVITHPVTEPPLISGTHLSVLQEAPFNAMGSVVEVYKDLSVWMGIRSAIEG